MIDGLMKELTLAETTVPWAVADTSSSAPEGQDAEQEAPPPPRLLELPHELLEKAVALLLPHEWGSFARASKTAKAVAQGMEGAVAAAEVSRRLVTNEHVGNLLCERCPALEIPTSVTRIGEVRLRCCHACPPPTRRPRVRRVPSLARATHHRACARRPPCVCRVPSPTARA